MSRPRRQGILGAAVGLVCVLVTFGTARAGTTGQLQGTIRDAKTGEPIGLASVAIPELKRGAVTDSQGNYLLMNVPAGKYAVRVSLLGYIPQGHEGVDVIPDFTTKIDFALESTVLKDVAEVVVKAERPLIQRDVTGTTRFLSGSDIRNQPLRGYQDAVAQQAGVVNFKTNFVAAGTRLTESKNSNTLIVRGGRPDEVAYYVDGFSQQDPLTGISTTALSNDAIDEVVFLAGGFNAEYGRVNSGIVNVVTREGGSKYTGSVEGLTDNLLLGGVGRTKRRDNNIYSLSIGGPVAPSLKQVNFYLSGERKFLRDRHPSFITDKVADPSEPGLFSDGILPNNSSDAWSGVGKLSWRPTPLQTLRIGGTYNRDDWREYINSFRFDYKHAPRYRDKNYSVYGTWNHSLSTRTFYEVRANYFLTDRMRGDGLYFDNLKAYSRPNGNPLFDPNEALFFYGDDGPAGASVYDNFLHRRASYYALAGSYTSQLSPGFQIKFGGDYQRHALRYYEHFFPTKLYVRADSLGDIVNVNHYGFDALGNEISEGDASFTDTNGNGKRDAGEPFVDSNGNGVYDDPIDTPRHPKTASAYVQSKLERLGLVLNSGLRFDYLAPSTDALRDELVPLDPYHTNNTELTTADLVPSKHYARLSPRFGVGFPVSDRTLLHVNYGRFIQQPQLQDLYVSYGFLEHKVQSGGYFVQFGNPNLKPEKTTHYEVGIAHTPTPHSRIQATAYYKGVKDLVEIVNNPSVPNNFSTFRNRAFATIKGLDVDYTLRRTAHFSMNGSYSLSWAYGTGSIPESQRNIAWTASQPPTIATPLDFDQRHHVSLNFDYRYGAGEGPTFWGRRVLENGGFNFLVNAGSGIPYTPTKVYNEVSLANAAVQPTGPINSEHGPWSLTVDLKAGKTIPLGGMSLDLSLWVLNLLNRDNTLNVYTSSGSNQTTNYLSTPEGEALVAQRGADFARLYGLAESNPNLHDTPRLVRFGAKLSF
jgi:outer membrane receptor protein involved in Fe transport